MRLTWLLVLATASLLAAGAVWFYASPSMQEPGKSLRSPADRAAFEQWLGESQLRRDSFEAFESFLVSENAHRIVAPWQLTRLDPFYAGRCDTDYFAIPPSELWPRIVPALRLVRDEVVPAIGRVEVLSSYRTPELNACARGAAGSKHLAFAALDLVSADGRSGPGFYAQLCAMHDAAGSSSRMGLGAYFDPEDPAYAGGRFHIDAEGYRIWGRDYTAESNPCRALNQAVAPV